MENVGNSRPTLLVQGEMERFAMLKDKLSQTYRIEDVCDLGFVVHPKKGRNLEKPVGLSFVGLIHGNEVGGSAVLNGILTHIASGLFHLPMAVGFALGNKPAALAGKRFLERDLNRSFDRSEAEKWEERRADELEKLLVQSSFLVDFHQTNLKSAHPFFIFPFSRAGYDFARATAPQIPVVTHWGEAFSNEGQCTDEYINAMGGVGITLELGQCGFDPYQVAVGIDCGLAAITDAAQRLGIWAEDPVLRRFERAPLYTLGEVLPYPKTGDVRVVPGWHNFAQVQAGERIATVDGKDICTSMGGYILFPKYIAPTPEQRPVTELCRIMKEISEHDLPSSSS